MKQSNELVTFQPNIKEIFPFRRGEDDTFEVKEQVTTIIGS
jgi:hypothetical protein